MSKHNLMGRRAFLKVVALGGTAALAWKLGLRPALTAARVSQSRVLMGTIINLTVVSDDADQAHTAINACLEQMQALEGILSRFLSSSQLSILNSSGHLENASPHLISVLNSSRQISLLSGGAFDISIKPLVDLYQEVQFAGRGVPSDTSINRLLPLVNYEKVSINGTDVSLLTPGMALTLDGIAKGYIVDQAVALLRTHGLDNIMVEAGGDLMAAGRSGEQVPWRIGLQPPRHDHQEVTAVFNITDKALATSGDYMQTFTDDYSEFHILDPRTGHSPVLLASASVMAPTVTLADGLATALMVMGPLGLDVIRRTEGCSAYVVTKNLQVLKTD